MGQAYHRISIRTPANPGSSHSSGDLFKEKFLLLMRLLTARNMQKSLLVDQTRPVEVKAVLQNELLKVIFG